MYLGKWEIDDLLTFSVNTHTASTGAETDADAVPDYRIYEDETGTAILTGSMAKLDDANTVGHYSEQITLSAANGFEVGKSYSIRIRAVVGGVAGSAVRQFQVEAAPALASAVATLQSTANGIDSKTTNLPTDPADQSLIIAATDAVMTRIGAAGAGLTALGDTRLANLDAAISTRSSHVAADVWAVGSRSLTSFGTLVNDMATAVWGAASRLLTAGTNIVLAKGTGVTGFNDIAAGAAMTLTSGERTALANAVEAEIIDETDSEKVLEAITDKIAAVNPDLGGLTVAAIASAVWSAVTRRLTDGTNIVLAKGVGVTGFNDVSEAQVNAQADLALADYDPPTHAELTAALGTADDVVLAAITALNNLSQANVRTALGLATANLDTQLDALPTNGELATALAAADDANLAALASALSTTLDAISGLNNLSAAQINTEVDTALADYDAPTNTEMIARTRLAAEYALQASVDSLETSVDDLPTNSELTTALGTADDATLAQIALVKAKTDLIPASPAAIGSAMTLTSGERDAVADATLKRDWVGLTGEASRSLLNALRAGRNKVVVSGTTMTVYKEDDTTVAWTGVVTLDAAAVPIIGVDPA